MAFPIETFLSVQSTPAISLLYILSLPHPGVCPFSSNTSPLLHRTHLPFPLTWTLSPSSSPLFTSRRRPPPHMNSVSTSITGNAGVTAPPSPASTVTLPNERSVLVLFSSLRPLIASFQCDRKRPCQRCIQLGLVIILRRPQGYIAYILPHPRPVSVCMRSMTQVSGPCRSLEFANHLLTLSF